MQGTIVMLMALSGLGCHHKACDVAYAPSCYSEGCYGGCYGNSYATTYETVVEPSCYSACYGTSYSGCYGGCYSGSWSGGHTAAWDSCGDDGCGYGRRKHGLFSGLFSCFRGVGWGNNCGFFGRHHRPASDDCLVADSCYSTGYGDYSPAVFGSSMPIYETPMSSGQGGPHVDLSLRLLPKHRPHRPLRSLPPPQPRPSRKRPPSRLLQLRLLRPRSPRPQCPLPQCPQHPRLPRSSRRSDRSVTRL